MSLPLLSPCLHVLNNVSFSLKFSTTYRHRLMGACFIRQAYIECPWIPGQVLDSGTHRRESQSHCSRGLLSWWKDRETDESAKNQTLTSQHLGRKQLTQSECLTEVSLIKQLFGGHGRGSWKQQPWGLTSAGTEGSEDGAWSGNQRELGTRARAPTRDPQPLPTRPPLLTPAPNHSSRGRGAKRSSSESLGPGIRRAGEAEK